MCRAMLMRPSCRFVMIDCSLSASLSSIVARVFAKPKDRRMSSRDTTLGIVNSTAVTFVVSNLLVAVVTICEAVLVHVQLAAGN
jgi:mannitol-specific phosphotransferase system IIBC component